MFLRDKLYNSDLHFEINTYMSPFLLEKLHLRKGPQIDIYFFGSSPGQIRYLKYFVFCSNCALFLTNKMSQNLHFVNISGTNIYIYIYMFDDFDVYFYEIILVNYVQKFSFFYNISESSTFIIFKLKAYIKGQKHFPQVKF